MYKLLAVGCGGFLGAISRYQVSSWLARQFGNTFPWGTLLVNVLGCLLMGSLMQVAQQREWFTPNLRLLLQVGYLGSLTTFSTYSYETISLLERGQMGRALLSMILNLALGLAAVLVGRAMVTE